MRSLTRRHVLHLGASSITLGIGEVFSGGALAVAVTGCGGAVRWVGVDVSSGQRVEFHPGAMPTGGTFTGSYISPQCGRLDLVQKGATLAGSYRRSDDPSAVGALMGEVTGNLARFRWVEHELPNDLDPSFEGTGFFLLDLFTSIQGSARLFGARTFTGHEVDSPTTTGDGGPWTAVRIA